MNQYLNYLKNIRGFSNNTLKVYKRYNSILIKNKLDYLKAINEYSNRSNATKRIILSAFKSYFKFIGNDLYKEILLPKKNRKICSYITFDEYRYILSKLNTELKTQHSIYIAIRILFETGIRSNELLSLKKNDILDQKIRILGKGNKDRYVFISTDLFDEIVIYNKKNKRNYLLFDFQYKNLYKRVNNLSTLINKKISPHSFRRGFATYCINRNVSIFELSMMMGHSQIETTKNYIYEINYEAKMKSLF